MNHLRFSTGLLDRIRGSVTAWAALNRKPWLAEEITSEAVLFLLEKQGKFRPGVASFETWALRKVRGFLRNRRRRRVWRNEESAPSMDQPVGEATLGSSAENSEARAAFGSRSAPTLQEALMKALVADQITAADFVLLACESRGYSRAHLAGALNLSDDSLRQRRSRSVREIRRHVQEEARACRPDRPISLSPSPADFEDFQAWMPWLGLCQLSAITQSCKSAPGHANYVEHAWRNRLRVATDRQPLSKKLAA